MVYLSDCYRQWGDSFAALPAGGGLGFFGIFLPDKPAYNAGDRPLNSIRWEVRRVTYAMTCDQGHDPVTMTVEADSDEEAMEKMMADSRSHAEVMHAEMAGMSDEERRSFIEANWTKS